MQAGLKLNVNITGKDAIKVAKKVVTNLKQIHSDKKYGSYSKLRDQLCQYVIDLCDRVYPKDKQMAGAAIHLTVELKLAEQNDEFVKSLCGFITWAKKEGQPENKVLTNIMHDLGEFARNRHKSWFSPRTSRYIKYFNGGLD